jgi:hypothetical protein
MYTNSITAHFLFMLHPSYTFFKAPEAISTLKFEDGTANQLYRCIKIISCYVVIRTKYNSIYSLGPLFRNFPPPPQNSLAKIMVVTLLTLKRPTHQSRVWDHQQLEMMEHSSEWWLVANVWVLNGWTHGIERATKKKYHMYFHRCHHTKATA